MKCLLVLYYSKNIRDQCFSVRVRVRAEKSVSFGEKKRQRFGTIVEMAIEQILFLKLVSFKKTLSLEIDFKQKLHIFVYIFYPTILLKMFLQKL